MSSIYARGRDVFLAALSRPPDERPAFVAEVCGEDQALLQEVNSLLKFHEAARNAA
jgi:hypothetical protein